MLYGAELVKHLEDEIVRMQEAMDNREKRIRNWETDEDDCFISERVESRTIQTNREKIKLIQDGGCAWFAEYAALDGTVVNARWGNTRYGSKLRAEMPDGRVIWTSASTKKGLEKVGLKRVSCKRPAWYSFSTPYTGMMGVYCGSYELFPSRVNYATGEEANDDPIEIKDFE